MSVTNDVSVPGYRGHSDTTWLSEPPRPLNLIAVLILDLMKLRESELRASA